MENIDLLELFWNDKSNRDIMLEVRSGINEDETTNVVTGCTSITALRRQEDGSRYVLFTNVREEDLLCMISKDSIGEIDFCYDAYIGEHIRSTDDIKDLIEYDCIDNRDIFVIAIAMYDTRGYLHFISDEMTKVNMVSYSDSAIVLISDIKYLINKSNMEGE